MNHNRMNIEQHLTAFARRRLTPAEWFVFSIPGQWPVSKNVLPRIAQSQSVGDPRGEVELKECEKAVDALLERGWIHAVTRSSLNSLQGKLADLEYGIPVYDLPQVGDVDFTEEGADIFRDLSDELYGPLWFSKALIENEEQTQKTLYAYNSADIDDARNEAVRRGVNVVSKDLLGKWCIYWWKRYESGWRITFEIDGSDGSLANKKEGIDDEVPSSIGSSHEQSLVTLWAFASEFKEVASVRQTATHLLLFLCSYHYNIHINRSDKKKLHRRMLADHAASVRWTKNNQFVDFLAQIILVERDALRSFLSQSNWEPPLHFPNLVVPTAQRRLKWIESADEV